MMESNDGANPFSHSVSDFDYDLPAENIAVYPMQKRDESKLLVYRNGRIDDARYFQIDQFLPGGSLMVFNNTRVVQARLYFKTSLGATIEVFCLEPEDQHIEVNLSMQTTGRIRWKCLVGELRKWKEDTISLQLKDLADVITLSARLISRESDAFIVEFTWTPSLLTFAEILERAGRMPLPPYIKRELDEEDKSRYQTIYADHEGSVAAPTAGLHYTPEIFVNLKNKNIDIGYVTLNIGAGTFKPIKTETVEGHKMHSEQFLVEKTFISKLVGHLDKGIVAVGTTSLRTLESLYWLGVKMSEGKFRYEEDVAVKQWDPYLSASSLTPKEALEAVLTYLNDRREDLIITRTQLLIVPGYKWKVVDVLATNFHQPKSTLVMLVASFIGDNWKAIYDHALINEYRFLSYGDGSLLFREQPKAGEL